MGEVGLAVQLNGRSAVCVHDGDVAVQLRGVVDRVIVAAGMVPSVLLLTSESSQTTARPWGATVLSPLDVELVVDEDGEVV